MADVYWGKVKAEYSLVKTALFLGFFPVIVEGPICRWEDVEDTLFKNESVKAENVFKGCYRIIWGLFKKMIIADRLAVLVDKVYVGYESYSGAVIVVAAISYTIQLYMEFSGCMDMVIGSAGLFGIRLPENFSQPFFAKSAQEFWQRWHISLGSFFRDYLLYVPFFGKPRKYFGLFLVWFCTGLWHGASWNFIAWGLYYFVLLTIEKTFLLKYLKKGKVWPHLYTLFFVVLGWGLFTANQPGAPLGLLLQKLFVPQGGISAVYSLRNYGVLLALGCVCS